MLGHSIDHLCFEFAKSIFFHAALTPDLHTYNAFLCHLTVAQHVPVLFLPLHLRHAVRTTVTPFHISDKNRFAFSCDCRINGKDMGKSSSGHCTDKLTRSDESIYLFGDVLNDGIKTYSEAF